MKIGFDAKRLYNNFTGLGNYSRFVVEALSKSYPENEYVLFTPRIKINADTHYFQTASNIATVTPPKYISKLKLSSIWRSFSIGQAALKEKISIYHGLSHELPGNMPHSIHKVVTIHDLIFLRYPQFYNRIDVAIYKAKVNHACKTADKIIAISNQTKEDILNFLRVDESKIKVVYQGCHSNFKRKFSDQQLLSIKQKYNLPSEFILNVGTIEPRKNALLILKALNILKNSTQIPLVIIGKKTPYVSLLESYASIHGLENRILYIHQIVFEDLPAVYRLAKIFVYPSLFEGFGIPLVEAIRCEVPVITSKDSCFIEAAGPASAYCDSNDENELADAIDKILSNPSMADDMKRKSMDYIKKFEPEIIAADVMELYKNL